MDLDRILRILNKYLAPFDVIILRKSEAIWTKNLSDIDEHITIVNDKQMRQTERTSLNRIVDISDWQPSSRLLEIMTELREEVHVHRKAWEYAMCIMGLEQLGAVGVESKAIAVGAGYERPIFYFANHIKEMVATDLYDNPGSEGDPAMFDHPEQFAPFPFRHDHLTVLKMDGTNLDFEDNTFHFGFSLSSIEHFGSRELQKRAMLELFRVIRPGGYCCISTELILNGSSHNEYFSFAELQETIVESTPFKIVGGELDLRLSESLLLYPIDLNEETIIPVSPHLIMKQGETLFTSLILFFQK